MKCQAILSLLVAVAAAAGAPLCAAQTASTPAVLFSRTYVAGDGSTYSGLYRIKPSSEQTVPLTITLPGVTFRPGDWSPDGSQIVYERLVADTSRESQLFVTGRQGPSDHPITGGNYMHQQPSWGPGGLIAFVSDRGNHKLCLSLVHADRSGQQDLFCPDIFDRPSEAMTLSTPKWNPSGKAVIFEAAAWEDNLEESDWVSHVYHVNVTTGSAVELTQQHLPSQTELTVAPDVKQGIYGHRYTVGSMYHVNFGTGTLTQLGDGRSPKYSRDGSMVAFDRSTQVYVMNADGSNVHPVIADPDPNAGYSVADWSWDGSRLLVNKTGLAPLMQIVDLATGATRDVGAGSAAYYGWYHD
jgi:Tol biopolymer transport system component